MSDPAWSAGDLRDNPHANADKARRVEAMFSAIAPSYDLNNRVHSLWQDQRWRRQAVKIAQLQPGDKVLDCACGTGDLTLAFSRALWWKTCLLGGIPSDGQVVGLDFTAGMLEVAREKGWRQFAPIRSHSKPTFLGDCIQWVQGDAMALPFADASFDVVSIAFGLRNVSDPLKAVREFHRVLKPGGRLVVLEFAEPKSRLLRSLYLFYFRHIMPRTAALIARDKSGAYAYLPRSVQTFLSPQGVQQLYAQAGFEARRQHGLTFGIAVCHVGVKPGV